MENKNCKCLLWARDWSREKLFSEHHPNCPDRDIESEAKKHLENILQALEYEASMGDGIADEFYDKYARAVFFTRGFMVKENGQH